jgi:hypothetical protein
MRTPPPAPVAAAVLAAAARYEMKERVPSARSQWIVATFAAVAAIMLLLWVLRV